MSGCHSIEICSCKCHINPVWLICEICKCRLYKKAHLNELKNRIEELEYNDKLTRSELSKSINSIESRLKKLEEYMYMEDRITVSDVLLRITKLENQVKFLKGIHNLT